jgi:hypothetical protein
MCYHHTYMAVGLNVRGWGPPNPGGPAGGRECYKEDFDETIIRARFLASFRAKTDVSFMYLDGQ